jgi:DNA-binding MarR family transcriptional regulator
MHDIIYTPGKTALIFQNEGYRRDMLSSLAEGCGLQLLPALDAKSAYLGDGITPIRPPDYILADLQSNPDQIYAALEGISAYLNEYGTEVLLWVSAKQLDLVDATFSGPLCHILCDAQDFEAVPILTGALTRMKMQSLRQDDSQTDYRALHRISDELADFARTLARLAEQDDSASDMLRDKPVSFRPAPAAIFEPLIPIADAKPSLSEPSAQKVRSILKLRRKRDAYFNKNLFADPAWDILLDLYAAELEGKKVSVSSLCIAACVPPTTGLRWIGAMTEDGLLVREHDPDDARRVFIRLSDNAKEGLCSYFVDAEIGNNSLI